MKVVTALLSLAIVALPSSTVLGQAGDHPFAELVGKRIESNNIFLLWQAETTGGVIQPKQKVYRYTQDTTGVPVDERWDDIPGITDGPPVDGNAQMVVASGQFNEDPYDDVIAVWEGEGQQIELLIPHFDTTAAMWNKSSTLTVAEPAAGSAADGRILVETGDFDGDGLDEFVLVYQDDQNRIQVQVYDTDGTLTPQLKASNADEVVPDILGLDATPFAVTVGDLDGDGREEIIQLGIDPVGNNSWALYWKVYAFTGGAMLDVVTRDDGFPEADFSYTKVNFGVEAGRYRAGDTDDLAFIWSFDRRVPAPNTADDTFLYLLEYDAGEFLSYGGNPDNRIEWNAITDAAEMDAIAMGSGDFDGDGLDEVTVSVEGSQRIYSSDNVLNLVPRLAKLQNQEFGSSYDYLAVADVNQDGRDELIVATLAKDAVSERFIINAFSVYDPEDGWLDPPLHIATLKDDELINTGSQGFRRFAIAAGSFDGYAFTLGEPIHSVMSDVAQPLVILNAPPIHFDIFNDTEFDINDCYSGNDCGFMALYEKTASDATEVSTEVMKDWGISAGLGVSGSIETAPLGVGGSVNFEAYFDVTFGRNFSEENVEGETITVAVEIGAVEDDLIYATVTDYDVWEYPAYYGTEDFPRRYIMAVEPIRTEGRWFPSKSWSGNAYIPDHEVGNILSYPAYQVLGDNPSVEQTIQADYSSDTFVLDANTSYTWNLDFASFTTNEADTTKEAGFDTKYRGSVRFAADYTKSNMSTHKTTVSNGLNLEIELSGIERADGETRYSVTPYAYWADNGALVVDYAVSPELSGPGGSPTWWQEHYGEEPDPAFILPWRYDPEKGFGISEEAKRQQTKDVIFDDLEPLPGDTLTLTARVRNFSLVSTTGPVTARFYVGDPDAEGTPIIGLEGETFASTGNAIPAQRWADAVMRWIVPADVPNNPRIYAVLNEGDAMPEIHTNNNKGFNILGGSGTGSPIEPPEEVIPRDVVALHAAYPNPFHSSTVIEYTIGTPAEVILEVHNVLGQQIETLYQGNQSAGSHRVAWDAGSRASGLYFVTLKANGVMRTQKVILAN